MLASQVFIQLPSHKLVIDSNRYESHYSQNSDGGHKCKSGLNHMAAYEWQPSQHCNEHRLDR